MFACKMEKEKNETTPPTNEETKEQVNASGIHLKLSKFHVF